jgi:hypothetical protein
MSDPLTPPSPHAYVPDPEADNQAVIDGFRAHLRDRLPPGQAETLLAHIDALWAELEAAAGPWIVDEAAVHHLRLTTLVLASYRTLTGHLPAAGVRELLDAAFNEPLRDAVREGTAQALDASADPFQAMVELTRSRELQFFGRGFTFDRPRDDDTAYFSDVRRCLYHDYLSDHGAPELTTIFCEFDASWIGAIDPARHGLSFERATTLGRGGALCPFHFRRVGNAVPPVGGQEQ